MIRGRRTRDPGTGSAYSAHAKRIINKDGSFNVVKVGLGYNTRNTYQALIQMSWPRFFVLMFSFLFIINLIFALAYYFIGVEQLTGTQKGKWLIELLDAYYFSFQTFTTVGYGNIAPVGTLANIVASIEAAIGWMCFAL